MTGRCAAVDSVAYGAVALGFVSSLAALLALSRNFRRVYGDVICCRSL